MPRKYRRLAVHAHGGRLSVHVMHAHIDGALRALVVLAHRRLHVQRQAAALQRASEMQQLVSTLLVRLRRHAVVVVQLAGAAAHRRVVVIVQGEVTGVVVARGLHHVGHGNESARAHVHGNVVGLQGDGLAGAARMPFARVEIEPGAGGREVHAGRLRALGHHRRHQEVLAPQVRGRHGLRGRVVGLLVHHRAHQRQAQLVVVEAERVVIRQQRVAQADGVARQRFGGGIAVHGFGWHFFLRVRAEYGLEHAVLQPARVQFVVLHRVGEAAQVRVHIAGALHAHLQRDFRLRLQAAPAAVDVARPRDDAVALRARVAGAHQDERPLGREVLLVAFGHQARPLVAIDVVHLVGAAGGVAHGGGVQLRLAQVAPYACHALLAQPFINIPQPVLARCAKNVDQARVAEEEIVRQRLAVRPRAQDVLVERFLPAARRVDDERLGNDHRLHAALLEVGHHAGGVGKAVLVPCQVAHRALDLLAEPVQVEHDGVERDVVRCKLRNGFARLRFRVIAEAHGEVAERPARRQRLPAGQAGVVAHHVLPRVARDHLVSLAPANGFPRQAVGLLAVEIEVAGLGVIEVQRIQFRRHRNRHAVVELLRGGAVAVVGLVVQRKAVAAPVHAHCARAGAVQRFAAVEREFDRFQFARLALVDILAAGGHIVAHLAVAEFFGHQRLALVGVGNAERRLGDGNDDAGCGELDAVAPIGHRGPDRGGRQHHGVRRRVDLLAVGNESGFHDGVRVRLDQVAAVAGADFKLAIAGRHVFKGAARILRHCWIAKNRVKREAQGQLGE
uniref:Uncharacterized protein n=1 Tax=Tanacetum cinerariifolium TaxID=118510 RepID=A0A699GFL0_TANCI|nr:hypothetical protein [Tanacetum cinerariifolium]